MTILHLLTSILESRFHAQSMRLLRACEDGSLDTVRTLLPKLYPPLRSKIISSVPPPSFLIAHTAKQGQAPVLQYLLDNLPVSFKEPRPWDELVDYGRHIEKSLEGQHLCGELFEEAVLSRCPSVVQVLLDAGMKANPPLGHSDCYPLSQAITNRDPKMVRFLLEKGANPHVRGRDGYTLFADAAKFSQKDIMLALLEHGARIEGSGALLNAARQGNIAIAKFLLRMGADINEIVNLEHKSYEFYRDNDVEDEDEEEEDEEEEDEEDDEEEEDERNKRYERYRKTEDINHGTALHHAVHYNEIEMVKWLLRKGAKKDLLDGASETPIDVAKRRGLTEIVKLLEVAK